MNIAIVGATGNVGRKTLEVLEKKELSIDNLYLVASSKSAGKKISFKGKEYEVLDLENFDFSKVKIAFFAAGGKISEKFAEKAAKHCIVIDNSSFYRMDPDVPLIVPQVNSNHLDQIKKNIIGDLRSACYSPHFKKVIGIAMINEPYCKVSTMGLVEIEGNSLAVKVCDLPFI